MKPLRSRLLGPSLLLAACLLGFGACSDSAPSEVRDDPDMQTVWASKTKPGAKPIDDPAQNKVGF